MAETTEIRDMRCENCKEAERVEREYGSTTIMDDIFSVTKTNGVALSYAEHLRRDHCDCNI